MMKVVELSDPEWGPFWVNYKFLKKKLSEIEPGAKRVEGAAGNSGNEGNETTSKAEILMKNDREVDFFRLVHAELKKTCDFFARTESLYMTRIQNLESAMVMLKGGQSNGVDDGDCVAPVSKHAWGRLLQACSCFYKDVLLLENFAIMNYCGFSKILKKHDKVTGFKTREAFMRNVMTQQNFTHYPRLLELLKIVEDLFNSIKTMETDFVLADEERLFIEAMQGLNRTASRLQEEVASLDGDSSGGEQKQQQQQGGKDSESSPANSNKIVYEKELDTATSAVLLAAEASQRREMNSPGQLTKWVSAITTGKDAVKGIGNQQPLAQPLERCKMKREGDSDDAGNKKARI
jgi:hypothetical protein